MYDTTNLTMNQRVARYRKMMGMRQEDMAKALGMKTSTYSQMERVGNIPLARIKKIAEILNVDPVILILGEKEETPPPLPPLPPFPPPPTPDDEIETVTWEEQLLDILRKMKPKDRQDVFDYAKEKSTGISKRAHTL